MTVGARVGLTEGASVVGGGVEGTRDVDGERRSQPARPVVEGPRGRAIREQDGQGISRVVQRLHHLEHGEWVATHEHEPVGRTRVAELRGDRGGRALGIGHLGALDHEALLRRARGEGVRNAATVRGRVAQDVTPLPPELLDHREQGERVVVVLRSDRVHLGVVGEHARRAPKREHQEPLAVEVR